MTTKRPVHRKVVKGWAIVSNGGVLIGGGDKTWGYTALCVYSTRTGARQHKSETRPTDKYVPCTITYEVPITHRKKK